MPLKRKASGAGDTSPSKRAALSSTNIPETATPYRRTRSAKQSPPPASPIVVKVRRTYGKLAGDVQTVKNMAPEYTDVNPEADLVIPSSKKTRGRRKQGDAPETPVKRQPRGDRTDQGVDSMPVDTPRRVRRACGPKLVVEVLLPPQVTSLPSPLPSSRPPSPVEPHSSPATPRTIADITQTPSKGQSILSSKQLPAQFHICLDTQKKAILRNLHAPVRLFDEAEGMVTKQLKDLLNGTIARSEGNSCLLLGPRGSGKSKVLDQCLGSLSEPPIIIRLSGWIHHTDRLAMREIAYQLGRQTGKSFPRMDEDDADTVEQDDNPFFDRPNPAIVETGLALPPPSYLPALISVIPTLSRPAVVILDAFDLFALHPRQALLYCLLDTVQGCRTSMDNKGLAVIGITTRIDTINLLEKRVKSRFSGRVIRTAGMPTTQQWLSLTKKVLCPQIFALDDDRSWRDAWNKRVSELVRDREVTNAIKDIVGLTRDPKLLFRILIYAVVRLSPSSPFPSPSAFSQAVSSQRCRPLYESLDLPYPALCLLIASAHSIASGHETFNFEMLFSTFRNQLRASVAAPVQVNGGSIGMVRCSRGVLLNAFEYLVSCRFFVPAATPSNTMAKEFARYRTTLEREEIRKTVERTGQVTLKKWLNKAD